MKIQSGSYNCGWHLHHRGPLEPNEEKAEEEIFRLPQPIQLAVTAPRKCFENRLHHIDELYPVTKFTGLISQRKLALLVATR